jgi:hypothetical protein
LNIRGCLKKWPKFEGLVKLTLFFFLLLPSPPASLVSPSFSLSLTLSSVARPVSQSLDLSPPNSSPAVTLSPSGSTPAGIPSASGMDLLSCYDALILLLSLETLTNSRRVRVLFALSARVLLQEQGLDGVP